MKNQGRLPHRTRPLVGHAPHHVVLTVRDDVPVLYRREVRLLFGRVQRATVERFPEVSFSAGVVMRDHLHLVMQAGSVAARISEAIQYLASSLALGINRIFGRRGTVFRDRFFSRALSTVSELVRALRYVGLNPVKAGLCRRPEDWVASSIAAHLNGHRPQAWSFRGWMYKLLGFGRDVRDALSRIMSGRTAPRPPGRYRQNRLPFARGRPA
jgi:REP element-mobilizing transposase RayT